MPTMYTVSESIAEYIVNIFDGFCVSKNIKNFITAAILVFPIVMIILVSMKPVYRILKKATKESIKKFLRIMTLNIKIEGDFLSFTTKGIFIVFILFCLIVYFADIFIGLFKKDNFPIFMTLLPAFLFMIVYIVLVTSESASIKWFIIGFSYLVVIVAISQNAYIIYPFIGKLMGEDMKLDYPALKILNFAYTTMMIFMLFSLQKTARKNSIVPS